MSKAPDLIKRLQRMGIPCEQRRSNHWRITTPEGPVFCASTPSDHRAEANIIAELRRRGIDI